MPAAAAAEDDAAGTTGLDATLLWVAEMVRRSAQPLTPSGTELAEWAEHTQRMPSGTRVAVRPPRGSRWRGRIDRWTDPGSGRLMAWVVPGGDAPVSPGANDARVLVAARFLRPA